MAESHEQGKTASDHGQTTPADPPLPSDNPPRPAPTADAPRPTDASIKETLESIVIALAVAFIFRAFIVEAFLIPTGSMAPTLLGQHLRVADPETGYRFAVGVDPPTTMLDSNGGLERPQHAASPMTGDNITLAKGTRARPGDRILVLKYLYGIAEPRRWDVVVFKAPHDPQTNFIKRLVGLPNEAVALIDGNVYTCPLDPDGHGPDPQHLGEGWRIARKADRPAIQRSVFAPIYDSWYVPDPAIQEASDNGDTHPWSSPWTPDGPTADRWSVNATRHYRYSGEAPGELRFDFDAHGYADLDARYPYNQFKRASNREPIEDIRLAVDLRPDQFGLSVGLTTTARLWIDGQLQHARLTARIDEGGRAQLLAAPVSTPDATPTPLTLAVETRPLRPNRITQLELWHVDHETILWIDGRRLLSHRDEVSPRRLIDGPAPAPLPEIAVRLEGGPATLDRVVLERDLYYAGFPRDIPARGGLNRVGPADQRDYHGEPLVIGPDRFWCIGDNSPQSDDGRFWNHIDPTVKRRFFAPDEFNGGRSAVGLVPRDLLVGRAFFVYFPAPLALSPQHPGLVPNLADMRFIR
ncbi:MAG: S26 family signal peptidase [Planctomycetota bacterium]